MTEDRIEKSIELDAPIDRVWRALSDGSEFGKWFGVEFDAELKAGTRVPARIVPTQVDPEIAEAQKPYEGDPFDIIVERVEPVNYLSFRWHPYAGNDSGKLPDEEMTLVEFHLEPRQEQTLLRIVESGFERVPIERRAEALKMNEGGWEAQTGLIRKYLAMEP